MWYPKPFSHTFYLGQMIYISDSFGVSDVSEVQPIPIFLENKTSTKSID